MNKELLLILKTLRKADAGILYKFCHELSCWNVECDCCLINRANYTYNSSAINIRYINTIEVLIEQ